MTTILHIAHMLYQLDNGGLIYMNGDFLLGYIDGVYTVSDTFVATHPHMPLPSLVRDNDFSFTANGSSYTGYNSYFLGTDGDEKSVYLVTAGALSSTFYLIRLDTTTTPPSTNDDLAGQVVAMTHASPSTASGDPYVCPFFA